MLRINGPVIGLNHCSQSWGRESMVGRICEKGRSWAGSERERELWMERVGSWQSEKMWQEDERTYAQLGRRHKGFQGSTDHL